MLKYSTRNKDIQCQTEEEPNLQKYQLVGQFNEIENCLVIAFKGKEKLVLGFTYCVKFYSFHDDGIHFKQMIGVYGPIFSMYLMDKKHELIIDTENARLYIFEMDNNFNWDIKFVFHKVNYYYKLHQIIMDRNEEEIPKVKQIIKLNQQVNGVCFNEQGTQFMAATSNYGSRNLIIFQLRLNGLWVKKQMIEHCVDGRCFAFIDDHLISFQSEIENYMLLLKLDKNTDLFVFDSFVKWNEIKDLAEVEKEPLQQIYNTRKAILFIKYLKQLLLFQKSQQNKFQILQIIKMDDYLISAAVTKDGEYLAMFNGRTKLLEVRKYV